MSYIYIKKEAKKKKPLQFKKKYLAAVFFSVGFFLFASAVFPIIKYQMEYSIKFHQNINPLSAKFYNRGGSILGSITTDYTQLSNWFVNDPSNSRSEPVLQPGSSTSYRLTIPTLKIQDAVVEVGSMDLKKSLIQYPQTALPGQLGNAVIFGHSVLPQFFNPKSYLTIFSTLYKLKKGDEILINFDNIDYKYQIDDMYEVKPTDLSVLEQRFDTRTLTLVTCSPPGTYLRRLIIKANLVNNQQ